MNYNESWKNNKVFKKQLSLNIKELENYPNHWYSFIRIIEEIKEKINLLDIGCGVGTYSELCKRHFKDVSYTGIDYSEEAITIAKETWKNNSLFLTKNVYDLDEEFISNYNLIHMGAFLDVLENANEVLKLILSFSVKYVLISRIDIAENHNCTTYKAYDEIITYKYVHGKNEFIDSINSFGYLISKVDGNNILLKKNN